MLYRLRPKNGRTRPAYTFVTSRPELDWPEGEPVPSTFFMVGMEEYEDLFETVAAPVEGLSIKVLTKPSKPVSLQHSLNPGFKPKKSVAFDPAYLNDVNFGEFQVVTQAFKDLVEELDPGVHQFIPVLFI